MIDAIIPAYNSKGNHLQGIIFKQTLDDFINLMFSKEPTEITYMELETQVQKIMEGIEM